MVSQLMRIEIDTNNDLVPGSETVILGTEPPFDGAVRPAIEHQPVHPLRRRHPLDRLGPLHARRDAVRGVGRRRRLQHRERQTRCGRRRTRATPARSCTSTATATACPATPSARRTANLTHVCTKVHSKGFRNPFRFKPNPEGGFNLGDVGQGSIEEIDIVSVAGRNYGWPCYEATHESSGYDAYQVCIDHLRQPESGDHAGLPVRARGRPRDRRRADLHGGRVPARVSTAGSSSATTRPGSSRSCERNAQNQLVELPFSPDWVGVDLVSAPNGDIAYASFGTGENGTGSIQRIVYAPNNARPVAQAQATPQSSAPVPQTVSFDGSESTDADGDTLTYEWNFDNGGAAVDSTEESPSFQYTQAGTYDVVLTVNDGRGQTDTDTIRVDVGNTPPVPSITAPATYTSGDTVTLQGSATDAQDADGHRPQLALRADPRRSHPRRPERRGGVDAAIADRRDPRRRLPLRGHPDGHGLGRARGNNDRTPGSSDDHSADREPAGRGRRDADLLQQQPVHHPLRGVRGDRVRDHRGRTRVVLRRGARLRVRALGRWPDHAVTRRDHAGHAAHPDRSLHRRDARASHPSPTRLPRPSPRPTCRRP